MKRLAQSLLLCLLAVLALPGCGNKGPLYLPEAAPAATEEDERRRQRGSD